MPLRAVILDELNNIADEHKRELAVFDDDSPLFSFGLDSLAFLTLVLRLKDKFGVDLFEASDDTELPMTVGELIHFYDNHLKRAAASELRL